MPEPVARRPIDPGLIARVSGDQPDASTLSGHGVISAFQGVIDRWRTAWFGPGAPLPPVSPEGTIPRAYDYDTSRNLRTVPRGGEALSFTMLRNLADSWDLCRLAIETRKDQMVRAGIAVRPIGIERHKKVDDATAKEIEARLAFPDGRRPWSTWVRALLDDVLVIDAAATYVRPDAIGRAGQLELIDGATIYPLTDETGREPIEGPAYSQIVKGVVGSTFTRDELVYCPRNPRTYKVYGYSPVEQIIVTVNTAIRRAIYRLQYYTEGNVPEAIVPLPETWSQNQVKSFQDYWDSTLAGNTAERRRMKFIPFVSNIFFPKAEALKDEYDEWLARVVAYAFSLPPTAFVKQVNRAVAELVQDVALEEGLLPLQKYVSDYMNIVIQRAWGYAGYELVFEDLRQPDPFQDAQTNEILVRRGVKSVDRWAEELGLPPPGLENALFFEGELPILIKDIEKERELKRQMEEKLASAKLAAPGDPNDPGKPGAPGKPGEPVKPGAKLPIDDDEDEETDDEDEDGKVVPIRRAARKFVY